MPRFEVTGTGKATGRQRKRIYEATTAEHARHQAEVEGTLVHVIVELPAEPPTAAQLQLAREHGIDLPIGANRAEISDLISLATWRDKPASADLQAIARRYGVNVTKYTGKKLLFQRIFEHLSKPGHEQDLAAWFAYRVYRELVSGSYDSPVKGPTDPLIATVARTLAADSAVIDSIRRYRGADLVWFGRWTAPDGTMHEGGSNRTTAYKAAAAMLRPFASSEKRGAAITKADSYNERPAPGTQRRANEPAKGIAAWLARADEAMRVGNSKPVKITRWHVMAWVFLAVMLSIIIFGPR